MNKNFIEIHKYLTLLSDDKTTGVPSNLILTSLEDTEYQKLSPPKQRQRLLGRLAAKQAIQKYYLETSQSLEYQQIEILNELNGAPYCNIIHPNLPPNELLISISHSNNYAVANIAHKLNCSGLGIDIEQIRSLDEGTVQRFLSKQEQITYREMSRSEKNEAGIIYWSAKEAYFKASKQPEFNPSKIDIAIERLSDLIKLTITEPARSKSATGYCDIIDDKFIITTVAI